MDATDILASLIKSEDGVLKLNDQLLGLSQHQSPSIEGDMNDYVDRTIEMDAEEQDGIPYLFHVPSSPSETSAISTTTPPPFFGNSLPTPPPSAVTSVLTLPSDGALTATTALLEEIPHVQLPEPKKRGPRPGGRRKKLSSEEKEEKAQVRMIRNRTAAQESRDKRKQYVEGLEDENKKLRRQNADLAQRLMESETEKQSFRAQLEFFTTQLSQLRPLPSSTTTAGPANSAVSSLFSSLFFPQSSTNYVPQSLHSFQPYHHEPQVTTTTYSTSSTSTISLADLLGFNANNSMSGLASALKQTTITRTTATVTTTLPVPSGSSNGNTSNDNGSESWWSWFFDGRKTRGVTNTSVANTNDDGILPPGVYSAKLGPSTNTNDENTVPVNKKKGDTSESKIKNVMPGVSSTRNARMHLYTVPGIKQRPLINVNRQ